MLRRELAPRRGKAARGGAGAAKPSPAAAELSGADQEVFEALRALRAEMAREQNLPAYVIFHDATLREMASERPRTLGEMGRINGVGASKLERYGERMLRVVAAAG
jgi:ATP-dependent DNA helicase RecQ